MVVGAGAVVVGAGAVVVGAAVVVVKTVETEETGRMVVAAGCLQ